MFFYIANSNDRKDVYITKTRVSARQQWILWPANTMWRKLLYSGFETCFGPSTQGAGTKTHLKSRFFAILKTRGAMLKFGIDGPSPPFSERSSQGRPAPVACLPNPGIPTSNAPQIYIYRNATAGAATESKAQFEFTVRREPRTKSQSIRATTLRLMALFFSCTHSLSLYLSLSLPPPLFLLCFPLAPPLSLRISWALSLCSCGCSSRRPT